MTPIFNLNLITAPELLLEIKAIPIHKSSGIPGISARVWKDCFNALSDKLLHIFNLSILTHTFPQDWKKAIVIPIPKKANSKSVNDLRPISLLPLPGKMLERLIHNKITKHIETNRLLTNAQNGFRKGHSTLDATFQLVSYIYKNHNLGNSTTAIFIDFHKAFDTVNHNILLAKLPGFGFNTHLTNWFRSYLSGRVQCTIANSTTSDWLPVTHGVPQGSILGPLMFLLYINDLSNTVSTSKSILFADDTVIFRADRNSDRNTASLRDDLDSLNDWCNRNKVTINTDKTKIVTFFPNETQVVQIFS